MPRFPGFAPAVAGMPAAIYSALASRLAAHPGETYPLHVGDTWKEPPAGCRMEDFTVASHPGMHRYGPVQGLPGLVSAFAERVAARTGAPTVPADVLVAAGGTGGLGAVIGAILAPGDEVLITAPYWPLIGGIVTSFNGVTVPVPFLDATDADSFVAGYEARRTPKTIAVYVNTPNNPSGRVLPRAWIEALVAWACRYDLWILSDEVYEDYVYAGEHVAVRPLAPDRTFSTYSASKAWGMAGNRVGFVVGPSDAMVQLRKVSTHTFYAAPTPAQLAVQAALKGPGDAWAAETAREYADTGRKAAARLGVPAPEGSTFLFVDVADALDDTGLGGFLERCVRRGLLVAPGPSFGPFPTHIRLCYTCAPPDVVLRGVDALAGLIGR